MPVNADIPLLGMVSRMDPQKGVDIALKGLRMLKKQNWQFVLLGAGDPKLEAMARKLQEDMPDRVRVETRYDAKLARQIYAGSDMLLMPSRYEPCGISQMIAMRYGCVPIVRAVGGLHDTVTDSETGFAFVDTKVKSFNDAVRRALDIYPLSFPLDDHAEGRHGAGFFLAGIGATICRAVQKTDGRIRTVSTPHEAYPKPKQRSDRRIRERVKRVEPGNAEG